MAQRRELEREVDPDNLLSKDERARRVESLRQSRIAAAEHAILRGRRLAREAEQAADAAEVALAALKVTT